ncbi:uncharacterized protein A4U43_C07F8620 [Asparagus officinalis]|uniref:CUE domain-containing protein n=1 Tax=Asparagus officinalis TaxID=4686 RepID=A0A5P1EAD5_ASPOF|nr:uncharacterized protein LOC109849817 isoform X2 [Asparagus officinalis]ONK62835.1 uncharacterized protein A4U43_C07F8620 [Asparagus officinalis]
MDYMPVYQNLVEIFPQVDSRLLKAAAFEHSNDVNEAVEFIVCEVLPSLSGPSESSDTAHNAHKASNEVQLKEHYLDNQEAEAIQPEPMSCRTTISGAPSSFMSPFKGVAEENFIDLESSNNDSSLFIWEKNSGLIGYDSLMKDICRSVSECEEQLSSSLVQGSDTISAFLEPAHDTSSSVNEKSTDSVACSAQVPEDVTDAFGEIEAYSKYLADGHDSARHTEMISIDDDNVPVIVSTRSGHVINIDLLDDFVADARNSKKKLVSGVESVVNMMKEAELLEGRAKQAKEEASLAGQNILTRVEELKQMSQHAQQTSDRHAGEVYGEKSVLSTEARELQSRLLNLSDERDKSFSVIEEIREALEARIADAKDEIAAAEQEKLEKEELAQKALKEQEAFMDAIVQESKTFQQQAEENAKLRNFLEESGKIVDTLQGEIDVICEDVMLLKRRVDERAPLKGSLLMSTYSSASSSSSSGHKSISLGSENSRKIGEDTSSSQEHDIIIAINGILNVDAFGKQKSASIDDWEFLKQDACPF